MSLPSNTPIANSTPSHGTPPPAPDRGCLPIPPSPTNSRQEAALINRGFCEYYWPRHFETGPVDPASFLDRILTDYSDYEGQDVIGAWLEDWNVPYKLYRSCLQYGATRGSPSKAVEVRAYQGVTSVRTI
jgi:hypothetical protein